MMEFLNLALTFPTVVFTGLLGLVMLYWLFVVLGALDIHMLEFDLDGASEGVAEGAGEALHEGLSEAAHEALHEGLSEAAHEAAHEAAVEAGGGVLSALVGLMTALRLRSAPMTVVLSVLLVYVWLLTFMGMRWLSPLDFLPPAALGSLVVAASMVSSVLLTSLTVRPLGRLFVTHVHRGQETLVGREIVIMTQTVTARHGQGRLMGGGGELILATRCERENRLTKGDKALIIDYDKDQNVYHVEPMDAFVDVRGQDKEVGQEVSQAVRRSR